MDRTRLTLLATLAALASACGAGGDSPGAPPAAVPGRILAVEARALRASADGAWVAWLQGCHGARGLSLPPGTASCELWVAAATGEGARRVAGAVTTLPHGFAWSPAGATLAALADYDLQGGDGTLVAWRDGAAIELAREVTFHGFGPRGELGFVHGGALSILLPGEAAPRAVGGAEGVATFDLSPAGLAGCDGQGPIRLLARRAGAGGGQLLGAGCGPGAAFELDAARVGEYGFAPGGERLAWTRDEKGGPALRVAPAAGRGASTVGRGAQRFGFDGSGRQLAWIGDVEPGRQGNLYVAESGRRPALLAREVGDFRWARSAPRLAWLEAFDVRVRAGAVGVGGGGLKPRSFGRNVTDFDLSPDGRQVAFLQHTARGGFSVDLLLAAVDGEGPLAPRTVAAGVFGFSFSPDGRWLYYRSRCTRNGEACDLERIPAAGLGEGGEPEEIARGIKSFEFDPRDPSRLLIGWQRMDRPALDLGVWSGGRLLRVGESAIPGTARFLGPDSRRVGWAGADPKRAGIYVMAPGG